MKPGHRGLRRLFWATRCSFAGLAQGARRESAVRQEMVLLVVGTCAVPWVASNLFQAGILVSALLLVLIVELLNSAVEATVDRISLERHELSGFAKDLGAAAVFVSLVLATTLWGAAAWERYGTPSSHSEVPVHRISS